VKEFHPTYCKSFRRIFYFINAACTLTSGIFRIVFATLVIVIIIVVVVVVVVVIIVIIIVIIIIVIIVIIIIIIIVGGDFVKDKMHTE